jgi:hypothetical protein
LSLALVIILLVDAHVNNKDSSRQEKNREERCQSYVHRRKKARVLLKELAHVDDTAGGLKADIPRIFIPLIKRHPCQKRLVQFETTGMKCAGDDVPLKGQLRILAVDLVALLTARFVVPEKQWNVTQKVNEFPV